MSQRFTHLWRVKTTLARRKDEPCRVIVRGRGPGPRNILVEFGDGYRVVTHRYAIRQQQAG
ncbi:hypothetical protein [Lacipirellula limnantheis]|uniref:Uncharacterized protein n=1 Tax=Lacipirellula limnantheis TaxID=2528024 RepID=A0A517TWZ9_9BACT|nr:hypothetical protein [Lacipirellula limnantheis]QDT72890.1 hypothetical protein I41_20750 [Lacipirellula limnantheis]